MQERADKPARRVVLILGGTTEAHRLAQGLAASPELLARFAPVLSLAGRTALPTAQPIRTRVGGFGGAAGLRAWLAERDVARVIDATHPFAARISRSAAEGCASLGIPLLALHRPAWAPVAGDRWRDVADMPAAADALGPTPRRVFLTIGRQELAAFARAPQHAYHARTIEPVGDLLPVPHLELVQARGPFRLEDERAFLRAARIDVVVSKNAGGAATYAKIAAARELGLPVVMVRRPALPDVPRVESVTAVLDWLAAA